MFGGSGGKKKSAKKADSKPTTETEKAEQKEKPKNDKPEKKTENAESKEKPAAAEGAEPNLWDAWISRYESGKGTCARGRMDWPSRSRKCSARRVRRNALAAVIAVGGTGPA